jgi:hypothetical protein
MYTRDSISVYHELSGPSTYTIIPAGDNYIIGISIQQSGTASTSEISCGSTAIAKNYGKDFPFNETMMHCTEDVIVSKSGQDSASYVITYLPHDKFTQQLVASVSGSLDFAPATAQGLHDGIYIIWTGFLMMILGTGIMIALWYLRRR